MDVYLLVHLFLISQPFLLLWRPAESAGWIRSLVPAGRRESAGAGSPITPTSDHFLLNPEEGAWPKTSLCCWEVAGSSGAVGIQTLASQETTRGREKNAGCWGISAALSLCLTGQRN